MAEQDLQRWRLDLAYNGAGFAGWARQRELRTVQGVVEDWIGRLTRLDPRLVVAGRTDAGVHARGQVAHLDLPADIDGLDLAERLERVLPSDIVLHRISAAPPGFDARFAASWRRYCYRIWDADSHPDPIRATDVLRTAARLDVEVMDQAGRSLLGLRDFAAFCKARDGASTIRTLLDCQVHRLDDVTGTIAVDVRADAFCHSMVRSLVGALVSVGSGRRELTWLGQVAASSQRAGTVPVLPPYGLTLEEVGYPHDAELAVRAHESRRLRTAAEIGADGQQTGRTANPASQPTGQETVR